MDNRGMARVGWDCARGAGSQGAINGAFDACFAPEFGSTRWLRGYWRCIGHGNGNSITVHGSACSMLALVQALCGVAPAARRVRGALRIESVGHCDWRRVKVCCVQQVFRCVC